MIPAARAPTLGPMAAPAIVLYDGVCGFCNGVVRFVLRRDPSGRFRFASLQSAYARDVLRRHGRSPDALDTFYLVRDPGTPAERVIARSDAALALLGALGGAWSVLAALRVLPRAVRDVVYGLVARNRYRIFGRLDACELPRPEWRDRFIEV